MPRSDVSADVSTDGRSKVVASLVDHSWENLHAAGEGHHLAQGPGPALEAEWLAAGLELPDLDAMRRYRLDRTVAELNEHGYDGLIVTDPMNIRYVSDTTNMQVWVMHNATRYAWVGADGHLVVWDYVGCEFLSGHNALIDEVRPAVGTNFFTAGSRRPLREQRWADELLSLMGERIGPSPRIAIDQASLGAYRALEAGGVTIGDGQRVMELARRIKGPDELLAMRCSIHACETTMGEMLAAMEPGMTERELWAMLHAGNIRRAGEWIETQILSSGPRTNPWMQEASARVIQPGELVAYDTDLVGPYGLMTDISRTWVAGDVEPTAAQRHVYDLAQEQIERNALLLTPGRSFHELCHDAWAPPIDEYRHYSCLFHGVGQCDEYPCIHFPSAADALTDGVVEVGMCFTTESFVGRRRGGEGVKLENQYVVTEAGPELLTHFPLDLQR